MWTSTSRSLAAIMLAVVLAGCGGGGGQRAFDDTDVMFLQMLIPHSEQGADMAELAKTRATRAEVRDLATEIEKAQRAEVDKMTAWLREWDQPTTVDKNPDLHAGHGGGLNVTPEAVIADMAKASGADFERLFLNTLTGHQHGAVELARMETDGGINPEAKDFAEQVIKSRGDQIPQLLTLIQQ